jgi:oxalate decarboxylase
MHWHPNADEWQYYISGHAGMTVFGSGGRSRLEEFGPGDVGYVPQGYGHYIENASETETCVTLIVLNSGDYQEISLSQWMASSPLDLLGARTFDCRRKSSNLYRERIRLLCLVTTNS